MAFICLQQFRRANKAYQPLNPNTENRPNTPPKIRRPNKYSGNKDSNDSVQKDDNLSGDIATSGQTDSSSGLTNSTQPKPAPTASRCNCCQQKYENSDQSVFTLKDLEADLPRFGPVHGPDVDSITAVKKEAWEHVLKHAPEDKRTKHAEDYRKAIKEIEDAARDAYDSDIILRMKKSDFRERMLIDGCFFLQLALNILGATTVQLGYTEKHIYFGGLHKERDVRRWIKAMFFVGNQIPWVVIRELMKQPFFEDVIGNGTWASPSDLPKRVLYMAIVSPELERKPSWLLFSRLWNGAGPVFRESPIDILHGLHCVMVGPLDEPLDGRTEADLDPDARVDADLDLEAGKEKDLDSDEKFPSASKLKESGVKILKARQGIREIKFNKEFYNVFPHLYVPLFTFNANTGRLLRYLMIYERTQHESSSKWEVSAYVRFMRDLIQTEADVHILNSKRIIQVNNKLDQVSLPKVLAKLGSSREIGFTQNLKLARLKANLYKTPRYWKFVTGVLLLTFIQTFFSILAYFKPPHNN